MRPRTPERGLLELLPDERRDQPPLPKARDIKDIKDGKDKRRS
jgi:hypothetical protein